MMQCVLHEAANQQIRMSLCLVEGAVDHLLCVCVCVFVPEAPVS